MFKAGRPQRADRRLNVQAHCSCCGIGMDSRRHYCGDACRKRAQREREQEAIGLYGISLLRIVTLFQQYRPLTYKPKILNTEQMP